MKRKVILTHVGECCDQNVDEYNVFEIDIDPDKEVGPQVKAGIDKLADTGQGWDRPRYSHLAWEVKDVYLVGEEFPLDWHDDETADTWKGDWKRRAIAERDQHHERKDREEYERLKAKYEGGG